MGEPNSLLGPATLQAISDFKLQRPVEPTANKSPASDALIRSVYAAAGKGTPPNGVIMIRQGFQPVLEAPISIENPGLALGTHFFMARSVDFETGSADWMGATLPSTLSRATMTRLGISSLESSIISGTPIANALSRIHIPEETRRKIDAMLTSGSTLTISDTGLGSRDRQWNRLHYRYQKLTSDQLDVNDTGCCAKRRGNLGRDAILLRELDLHLALTLLLDHDEGDQAIALGIQVRRDRAQRPGIAHVDAQGLLHLQRFLFQRLYGLQPKADAFRPLLPSRA